MVINSAIQEKKDNCRASLCFYKLRIIFYVLGGAGRNNLHCGG